MSDLGFFTDKGERLAATLLDGICLDIEAGDVSPRGALDRLVRALDTISRIDEGAADADILITVIKKINKSLRKSGMSALSAENLREHAVACQQKEASSSASLPMLANLAVNALARVEEVLCEVSHLGIAFSVSPVPPWNKDYGYTCDEEISLWVRPPTVNPAEATWALGCIVLGKEASQYLDVLTCNKRGDEMLNILLPDVDTSVAMPLLQRLDAALHDAGLALADAPWNNRLGLSVSHAGITMTWDGVHAVSGMPLPSARWEADQDVAMAEASFATSPSVPAPGC